MKIAGLMTLTVVRPDDMADRILDRQHCSPDAVVAYALSPLD